MIEATTGELWRELWYRLRLGAFCFLTAWSGDNWCDNPNTRWRRRARFWIAKGLGLHATWRAQGACIPRWWPRDI